MRSCCTIFLSLLISLASLPAQTRTRGPSISFDTTDRDVGKITQGETIRQTFSFTNKGPGTLEILNIGQT